MVFVRILRLGSIRRRTKTTPPQFAAHPPTICLRNGSSVELKRWHFKKYRVVYTPAYWPRVREQWPLVIPIWKQIWTDLFIEIIYRLQRPRFHYSTEVWNLASFFRTLFLRFLSLSSLQIISVEKNTWQVHCPIYNRYFSID